MKEIINNIIQYDHIRLIIVIVIYYIIVIGILKFTLSSFFEKISIKLFGGK